MSRPFYAALLAPTLVLAAYGGTHVSPDHLWRPLIVGTVVGLILFGLVGLTRRWDFAALVTALALLAVIGLYAPFALLAVAGLVVAWTSMRRGALDLSPLTQPLNVLVSLWFAIAAGTAVWASLPPEMPDAVPVTIEPGPNVYLVLLDGYPRADSLLDYFGFDNRTFLDALEERGFDVADGSHSQYVGTSQVVPTMLHQRPLEELLGESWDASDAQYRRLWHLLNEAPIFDAYEAAGYTTYSVTSSAEALDWRTADVVLASGWPTRFEDHLVNRGILDGLLPYDAMDRAELIDGFRHLRESAGSSPRFVFAHMMTPHNPYVFTANGSPAEPCGSECTNHAGPPNPDLADRFLGQLRWTNGQVLEAVDHIVAVDPTATVIVFSDHGLRRDRADMDEWHRTLFAARGATFPDDIAVADIFGVLR